MKEPHSHTDEGEAIGRYEGRSVLRALRLIAWFPLRACGDRPGWPELLPKGLVMVPC